MRIKQIFLLVLLVALLLTACNDSLSDTESPGTPSPTPTPSPPGATGAYSLLAWNDLGMHCVDGKDYSIFSILPPYNNLHAQLVDKNGGLVSDGVSLTYEAIADATGSINTTSVQKTNFWSYVDRLFGVSLKEDIGLTGNPTSSLTPASMSWNGDLGVWSAEGIPITPVDDNGNKNFYPMVRVVARDAQGAALASADTVLPVSDEMTCAACHSSVASGNAAQTAAHPPKTGWVFASDPEKDWKENILALHDDKHLGQAPFQKSLGQAGYDSSGLLITALSGQPVLCAACHGSNALPGTGQEGIAPLTEVLHSSHGKVLDPSNLLELDASTNRTACYMCHPGSQTKCLRGAMGGAVDAKGDSLMSCQSCHGSMSLVGSHGRTGWLDEPNCQSCHFNGQREVSVFDASGALRKVLDTRFATNPDTPKSGFSLFRFSSGHGGLQCEACHGSTHAIYPSIEANDNVLSSSLQGHVGTISECVSCHQTVPFTANKGPHGMHSTNQQWVGSHGDYAEHNGAQSCAYCHGSDYRGSFLSTVKINKSFSAEHMTVSFKAGDKVSCYSCHNGPGGGDD